MTELRVVQPKTRPETEQEFIDEALRLANENDADLGEIVGFSIVVMYESGSNVSIEIPDHFDRELFKAYNAGLVSEGIEAVYGSGADDLEDE